MGEVAGMVKDFHAIVGGPKGHQIDRNALRIEAGPSYGAGRGDMLCDPLDFVRTYESEI